MKYLESNLMTALLALPFSGAEFVKTIKQPPPIFSTFSILFLIFTFTDIFILFALFYHLFIIICNYKMLNIILSILFVSVVFVGGYYFKNSFFKVENENKINNNLTINNQMQNNLKIEVLKEGNGVEIKNNDKATMHYTGTLGNGQKFDSSLDRGQPFKFVLGVGQVIKGWDLGVLGMKINEKRKLTIPYEFAYGEAGIPGVIPPKSTLIFEVELLGVN